MKPECPECAVVRTLKRAPALLAESLIRGYQVALSPLLVGSCKFCPSCSDYCIHAVREWGVFRGCWLGLRRLLRCHPFSSGGIDPVPPRSPHASSADLGASGAQEKITLLLHKSGCATGPETHGEKREFKEDMNPENHSG